MSHVWSEFKTTIFPWIVALLLALGVQYMNAIHLRTVKEEAAALRQLNAQLAEQVGHMSEFLATHGYVASSFRPSR
ncbi:MAG: hypothetical protein ACO3FT_07330 [Ilumatobacteraceae bacterium]